MNPRRVMLMIEVDCDATLKQLRQTKQCELIGVGFKRLYAIEQIQANVIRPKVKERK